MILMPQKYCKIQNTLIAQPWQSTWNDYLFHLYHLLLHQSCQQQSFSVSSLAPAMAGPAQSDVIGDHLEVVPGIQLPLSVVVVHHAVVTVLVF